MRLFARKKKTKAQAARKAHVPVLVPENALAPRKSRHKNAEFAINCNRYIIAVQKAAIDTLNSGFFNVFAD
jgi:hypothetical protein